MKIAGISAASLRTRLSAGCRRICIESKSSTPSRAITISPSSAEWGGSSSPSGRQLREVAQQRPPVARPERELAAVVLEHAAEAVPLRLVLPASPAGSSRTSSASIGGKGTFGPGTSARLLRWASSTASGRCGASAVRCRRCTASTSGSTVRAGRRCSGRCTRRSRSSGASCGTKAGSHRGLVDAVEPGEDGWWDGVARYRGRRAQAASRCDASTAD